MRSNVLAPPPSTHEGARASRIGPLAELRRSVMTALLWESSFYEGGDDHAKRLSNLVTACKPELVAAMAVEARERMHLRHVPLYLVRELARVPGNGTIVAETLNRVIQRPDELGEFLAIYWKDDSDAPISAGVKRGLAAAFGKFNEYLLGKYNSDKAAIKLKDVMRLVHPDPINEEQAALWQRLVDDQIATPDTWEVQLSAGADKKETFERLLRENKLGGLAFLRNLRNMVDADVDRTLIKNRFLNGSFERVLPFRFLAAAQHAKSFTTELNHAMLLAARDLPPLLGTTVVLVDVSGSMKSPISAKSDMRRADAAHGVAILVREACADCRVFSFSNKLVEVANHRGTALADAIWGSQDNSSTQLGRALQDLYNNVKFERLIVVTDEQSHDRVPEPPSGVKGYVINVATNKNGVGYGKWNHIDGWSERILDFILEAEA